MKAFIFGTFNPVTMAHVNMGVVAKNRLEHQCGNKCEVVYIPTSSRYIRYYKGYREGSTLPDYIRVQLLKDAVSKYGFSVSTIEINGVVDGRTYNTISYFGFDDAVLCLGMDNIAQMKKWYKWRELLQKCRLLVFRRKGFTCEHPDEISEVLEYSSGYDIVDLYTDQACISSTEVRRRYMNGDMEGLKSMVPSNVFDYLSENKNVYYE